MMSPDLALYPPKAKPGTEHPLWIHGDADFLDALQGLLAARFGDGGYPTFAFERKDPAPGQAPVGPQDGGRVLFVRASLAGEDVTFIPGDYSADIQRMLDVCLGFEQGWLAARNVRVCAPIVLPNPSPHPDDLPLPPLPPLPEGVRWTLPDPEPTFGLQLPHLGAMLRFARSESSSEEADPAVAMLLAGWWAGLDPSTQRRVVRQIWTLGSLLRASVEEGDADAVASLAFSLQCARVALLQFDPDGAWRVEWEVIEALLEANRYPGA